LLCPITLQGKDDVLKRWHSELSDKWRRVQG
jgi:hypothetical protein